MQAAQAAPVPAGSMYAIFEAQLASSVCLDVLGLAELAYWI